MFIIYFLKLLDFEPRAGQQVPLLMKMHKDNIALSKAIESGDTDLGISEHTYKENQMLKQLHGLKMSIL